MGNPICREGMVPLSSQTSGHTDRQPTHCVDVTETPQEAFMDFLRQKYTNEYYEVNALLDTFSNVRGPQKPAVFASWYMANAFCQSKGGNLPTNRQWEDACGSKKYCTKSGRLTHVEVIYGTDGPANISGSGAQERVNEEGVQDLTGNVSEWVSDGILFKDIRGGSWYASSFGYSTLTGLWQLHAKNRNGFYPPNYRLAGVGFRCVVPVDKRQTEQTKR